MSWQSVKVSIIGLLGVAVFCFGERSLAKPSELPIQSATANGTGWTGVIGNGAGYWSEALNWDSASPAADERNLFFGQAYRTANGTNIFTVNDLNNYIGYRITFENITNPPPFSLTGNDITLADFNGGVAKIENQSTAEERFFADLQFGGTLGWAEINPVNGGLVFFSNNTISFSGAVAGLKFFGSQYILFENTINGDGKWFALTGNGVTVQLDGSITTGDFYVMNGGSLLLNSGFLAIPDANSALRLGGDFGTTGNQDLTKGAAFHLTNTAGGQSFSGTMNTVATNTSGALLINSHNTSGTNTIGSQIFLDSDLQIQQASDGTLRFQGGGFDIKNHVLTFGQSLGSGSFLINETLGSSFAAGGSLGINGGTVVIQSTNNNYTGADPNQLNPQGTQIVSGRLGIYGDGSLGLVPANAYNNISFSGGILQDAANDITLDAKRNISVSGSAGFDPNGHVFTIGGVISGFGSVSVNPAFFSPPATVRLSNPASTYSGGTKIFYGTLEVTRLSNSGISSSLGTGTEIVVSNGSPGTLRYVGSGDSTDRTLAFPFAAGTLDASGTGPIAFTNSSAFLATNDPLTLILTGSNTGANTLRGVLVDPSAANFWFGSIIKDGPGQWILSGTSPYTGTTTVKNGTLTIQNGSGVVGKLSGTSAITVQNGATLQLNGDSAVNDRLSNNALVTLTNGILRLNGVPEGTSAGPGLSSLRLFNNTIAVLDLAGDSLLHLAASGNQTWTGTLSVWNWNGNSTGGGSEQLLFGVDDSAASLTQAQLNTINFYGDSGTNFLGTARFAGLGSGEIIPFPPLAFWRKLQGLASDGSQDLANPSGDGISNLLKYAFNIAPNPGDLANVNVTILTQDSSAGLPFIRVDSNGRLVIDFIRRKATSNPGIAYSVETGNDVTSLSSLNLSTATITSIDNTFERVSVTDPMITPSRFGRVRVTPL